MVRRPYSAEKNQPDTIMCAATTCNNVSSALYYMEDRILEALKEWLSEYKLEWTPEEAKKLPEQISSQKSALKRIDKEIEKMKNQMDKIYDLLEQGVYSTEMFLERSSVNSQKIEQLKKDKAILESNLKTEVARNESRKTIIPKIEKLLEVYKNLKTPKAKNDMLKEILEKVVYTKDKGGRWHNSPDNFEIILYPKLPDSSLK